MVQFINMCAERYIQIFEIYCFVKYGPFAENITTIMFETLKHEIKIYDTAINILNLLFQRKHEAIHSTLNIKGHIIKNLLN